MQASSIEKAPSLRPQFNSVKAKPQKEAIKPRYFAFTAEDLYNCLHQKSGTVEPINLEESRSKKMDENSGGKETRPSCKLTYLSYLFFCLFIPICCRVRLLCCLLACIFAAQSPSTHNQV